MSTCAREIHGVWSPHARVKTAAANGVPASLLEVPRSSKGWQLAGHELDAGAVAPNPRYKAPQAKALILWCGGPSVDDCKILSCVPYTMMNGPTAIWMCRRGAGA